MDHVSTLREIERRAHARPCSRHDLLSLESELESYVRAFRSEREVLREKFVIDTEPRDFREAIYAARIAIRHAVAEHSAAEIDVRRIQHLVHCGHVHQAAIERSQMRSLAKFPDLNLDFIETAASQQTKREHRLVIVAIVGAIFVLVIATLIELVKRSHIP